MRSTASFKAGAHTETTIVARVGLVVYSRCSGVDVKACPAGMGVVSGNGITVVLCF